MTGDTGDDGSDANDVGDHPGEPGGDPDSTGCPKCGQEETSVESVSTTSSGLAAIAEFQDQHFTVVRCRGCGYCEFYSGQSEDASVRLFLGEEYVPPGEDATATKKQSGPVHYCNKCGATVDETDAECPGCGREFV